MSRKRRTHIKPVGRPINTACGLKINRGSGTKWITQAKARDMDAETIVDTPLCVNCLSYLGMLGYSLQQLYISKGVLTHKYKPRKPKGKTMTTKEFAEKSAKAMEAGLGRKPRGQIVDGPAKKAWDNPEDAVYDMAAGGPRVKPEYDGKTWLCFNFKKKWGSQIPQRFVDEFLATGASVGDMRFRRVKNHHNKMVGIEMLHQPTGLQQSVTVDDKSADNFIGCFRIMTAHLKKMLPGAYGPLQQVEGSWTTLSQRAGSYDYPVEQMLNKLGELGIRRDQIMVKFSQTESSRTIHIKETRTNCELACEANNVSAMVNVHGALAKLHFKLQSDGDIRHVPSDAHPEDVRAFEAMELPGKVLEAEKERARLKIPGNSEFYHRVLDTDFSGCVMQEGDDPRDWEDCPCCSGSKDPEAEHCGDEHCEALVNLSKAENEIIRMQHERQTLLERAAELTVDPTAREEIRNLESTPYVRTTTLDSTVRDLRQRLSKVLDIVMGQIKNLEAARDNAHRIIGNATDPDVLVKQQKLRGIAEMALLPYYQIREIWPAEDEIENDDG